jgi:hypothetical protein
MRAGKWVHAGGIGWFFIAQPAICNARPMSIHDQHWSQNNQSGDLIPQWQQ